jgi:two-component system cell cycle sensor histidine kinase PleC
VKKDKTESIKCAGLSKGTDWTVQEALEYVESIVDTVREPLVILDADLHVMSANRSFYQTFKVTPGETEGKLIYDLGNRQWDIPSLRELLEEILPENTVFENYEVEHDFETIGQRTMLLNARRIYRQTNKTQMILLAIEDITEPKEAEEALQKAHQELAARVQELAKANEEMQSFIYSISHDLRMPLVAVQGFANLLKEEYGEELKGEAEKYLSAILQSTGKMSDLIEDLLQLSRVGRMDTEPEEVALESLVEAITTELTVKTPKRKLNFRIKEPLPETYCNRKRLYQVFSNLLGNAVKFTSNLPEAKIEVGVKKEGDEREFYVRDNGPGIDPQYHEEIFKVFRKFHGAAYEGSGMGLTFAKKIVESWGGKIRLESKPGKGATFYFTIPEARKSSIANSEWMTSDSSDVVHQVD